MKKEEGTKHVLTSFLFPLSSFLALIPHNLAEGVRI